MPSAWKIEVDESSNGQVDEIRADLQLLLREIRGANIHSLNSLHGRGAILFAESEPARGVYILRTGRATVSISSSEGRIVMLRLAQPGDVLGLNTVLRNSSYDTTVKALEPCRTDFISRAQLKELIETSLAATQAISRLLSHELAELTERTRLLLLSQTANARLAKLMLEWSRKSERIDRVFTHEEIAEMICSSRETVTRLLAGMNRRKVIQITSDSFLVRDGAALERMALNKP
jgi:CRP/FNR family transcriptional regulator, cyclic AMP receptor protein